MSQKKQPDQQPQPQPEKKEEPRYIKVGGDTYRLSPVLPGPDLVAVRNFIAKRTPSALTALMADPGYALLPDDMKAVACNRAVEATIGGGAVITPEGATRILMQPDGVAFLVWLLTRRNHPGLQLESIRPHVTEDNCETLFAEVSGLVDVRGQEKAVRDAQQAA